MSLGGWSQEMDTTMYEIVGSRSKKVLKRMQKAALSGTFNIAWTFKVVTWETIDCYRMIFFILYKAKFGFVSLFGRHFTNFFLRYVVLATEELP